MKQIMKKSLLLLSIILLLTACTKENEKNQSKNKTADRKAETTKAAIETTENLESTSGAEGFIAETELSIEASSEITNIEETTLEITAELTTKAESATEEEPVMEIITEPITEAPTLYVPKVKNTSEYVIAIDAGHQAKGNFEKEPVGPGSTEMKNKVAGGTCGVATGTPEYELTLAVALKLKEILIERGYQVVMVRETNDVDISNAERAQLANEAGADVFLRIHADAEESGVAQGMTALCQRSDNPYNGELYEYSRRLSECVINAMTEKTGARNRGISETNTMSGINWAQVPAAIIEMGFMTNGEEDMRMETEEYRTKLALGMANGIEDYLGGL